MKKLLNITVIAVGSVALIFWVVLSDFELGKYDDYQEAIEKGIPYEINNIIYTEQHDNVTVVMYTTSPDKKEFPFGDYDVLAVAFFKGNDKEGWENIGHHGWTHYDNDNMTIYNDHLRDYDNEGNTLHEFYVVFGEINNPEIATVEIKTKEEKAFKEVKIINNKGNRYYFHIGEETIVRGLSAKGRVIDRQGG